MPRFQIDLVNNVGYTPNWKLCILSFFFEEALAAACSSAAFLSSSVSSPKRSRSSSSSSSCRELKVYITTKLTTLHNIYSTKIHDYNNLHRSTTASKLQKSTPVSSFWFQFFFSLFLVSVDGITLTEYSDNKKPHIDLKHKSTTASKLHTSATVFSFFVSCSWSWDYIDRRWWQQKMLWSKESLSWKCNTPFKKNQKQAQRIKVSNKPKE